MQYYRCKCGKLATLERYRLAATAVGVAITGVVASAGQLASEWARLIEEALHLESFGGQNWSESESANEEGDSL